MKGRIFLMVLAAAFGLAALFYGQQAQARSAPLMAIDAVFTAVNSGEVNTALASFAEDAIAEDRVRGATYRGASEIRQMLESMQRSGRRYDIVAEKVNGDTVTVRVEVSDRGHVWGSETIVAEMQDGKLKTFNVTAFRLHLDRIGK